MCFRPPSFDDMMTKCPQCGAFNAPELTKCKKCGADLTQAQNSTGTQAPGGAPNAPKAPGGVPSAPSAPKAPNAPKA